MLARRRERACGSTFVSDIAPERREHHPDPRPHRRQRLPLHAARPGRREPALPLLRPAGPQGAGAPHAHRAARAGPSSRTAPSPRRATPALRRRHRSLRRDQADQHVPDRVRGRALGGPRAWTVHGRTHHRLRAPVARGGGRPRHAARAQQPRARLDGAVLRAALPVREVRLRAGAGVSVRRDGAPGRGLLQRGPLHLPRAADAAAPPRPLLDHPPRGGAPVVRRPGHDALVRRPLAQGGLRHVHGREGAGRPRAASGRVEDLLPRQQAGRVRRGPDGRHDAALAGARQSRSGQEQLRRDRLQQGAVGAQAAQVPRRRLRVPGGSPAVSRRATPTPTPAGATCWARSARPRGGRSTASDGSSCCGRGCR